MRQQRSAAFVLWILLLSTANDVAAEQSCEASGACAMPATSILQARTLRERSKESLVDSSASRGRHEHLTAEGVETEVLEHGDYRIITHSGYSGKRGWLLWQQGGCVASVLEQLTKNLDADVTAKYTGHPGNGGMCFLIVEATLDALKRELEKRELEHSWPTDVLVEEDAEWGLMPDEVVYDVHEEDEGASLLSSALSSVPQSWGLDRIDARSGLDSSYDPPNSGLGVNVFVADTGILITHQDFEGRAYAAYEALSSTPIECNNTNDPLCATDRNGHGTHCAGTVGGKVYGVAKQVTLHAVKVLDDGGSGAFSWFIEALELVELSTLRPAVFSASLGGSGVFPSVTAAIDDAVAKGVAVVVAAGNQGRTSVPDACDYTPAHAPNAITVGSTESDDDRSSFSSYGSCLDIFAPGTDIKSAYISSTSSTATMSGTSMACPHVAGAVALLFEQDPSLTVQGVTTLLLARATQGAIDDVRTGLRYMHIESSQPRVNGDTAVLESDPLDFVGDLSMEFVYHMFGRHVNTLQVAVDGNVVWSKTGDQGNQWFPESVVLTPYQGSMPTISFVGICGNGRRGDIAIDSVKFVPAQTVMVVIGKSTANTKCVNTAQPVQCSADAGDRGKRVNQDRRSWWYDFTISKDLSSGQICAKREDRDRGWGVDLRIRCTLLPSAGTSLSEIP